MKHRWKSSLHDETLKSVDVLKNRRTRRCEVWNSYIDAFLRIMSWIDSDIYTLYTMVGPGHLTHIQLLLIHKLHIVSTEHCRCFIPSAAFLIKSDNCRFFYYFDNIFQIPVFEKLNHFELFLFELLFEISTKEKNRIFLSSKYCELFLKTFLTKLERTGKRLDACMQLPNQ